MTFRRRRNLVLLAVLGLIPVIICVAVKVGGRDGGGGSIFGGVTQNGLFAVLAAFLVAIPLFIPLVISVVAGESIAGEASSGTLRYLLAVPVGRTRLVAVKFAAVVLWSLACVLVVAVLGLVAGLIVFPSGDVMLLSGRAVSYAEGLGRLSLVTGYIGLTVLMVGALGLCASTMTELPLAAMAATLTLTIASEVVDAVPQFGTIHGWLPTHYWLQWVDLLRDPVDSGGLVTGLLVSAGYVALFVSLAWARFGGKDVTN
ncbi:MAG: ABC transporter permease [Actinomycetota bacterium]|nr:ABC transporter permease [Actinomycetota bacterium]